MNAKRAEIILHKGTLFFGRGPLRMRGQDVCRVLAFLIILSFVMSVPRLSSNWQEQSKLVSVQAATEYVDFDTAVDKKLGQAMSLLNKGETHAILSLSDVEVLTLLGSPDFNRREGNIHWWQYRSDVCIVDIFFQTPVSNNGDAAVLHYKLHHLDELENLTGSENEKNCLNSVL